MQDLNAQPFPFMEMPPELRDMVYEYLVEDPYYPPQEPPSPTSIFNPVSWLSKAQALSNSGEGKQKPKKGSWIFLTCKQIYAEYSEVSCKKSTFHLSVTPSNYPHPLATSTSVITSSPGAAVKNLWKIGPETLKHVRKCDLMLVITSDMLGVADPRNMASDSWVLAHQVRAELRDVSRIQELNLHVKAIGDPLWNPLWVWYHATQSFKNMGVATAPSALPLLSPTFVPTIHPNTHSHSQPRCRSRQNSMQKEESMGPKFNRITFSLDTWSPGENHLERDPRNSNQWGWYCTKGHLIMPDGSVDMPVREFCANLYKECWTCRPELDGDSENEEGF
jgi:hypothetical protein